MGTVGRKRILLADVDLLSVATTIGALKDDYLVVTARSGEEIFKQLNKHQVDMVILETNFPDMDGFEICRRLKADEATATLPVVFLSNVANVAAEEKGFAIGAVEYVTKPFNTPTLKARLKNEFKLSNAIQELQLLNKLALDANPNTGLPGNVCIHCELQRLVEIGSEDTCVIYADLDNFKAYNDTYGFTKGDALIVFAANVIRVAMQSNGCAEGFLGHIGGDDFVFILPAEKLNAVTEEIIQRFDQGIAEFYSAEDAAQGYVVAIDREGKSRQHPLVGLSMGAIDLSRRKVTSSLEIVDVCSETKNLAKKRPGSNVFVDQRRST